MKYVFQLALATVAILGTPHSTVRASDAYPDKPVRLVVGFAPGGFHDIVGRLIAEKITPTLGQRVYVENRPGAGGTLGAGHVAQASADGYTLLIGAVSNIAIAPTQFKNLQYDPLRDFSPIARVAAIPNILVVHPSFAAQSVRDLIQLAKQRPGSISYASAGLGASSHLMMEYLGVMTGTKLLHVPYKGEAPGMADVVGGQVSMIFASPPIALPQINARRLRPIAVSTKQRSSLLPDIPTIAESGGPSEFDVSVWLGIFAPAGTPVRVVEKLNDAISGAVNAPDVREKLASYGAEAPKGGTGEEFAAYIKLEVERWSRVAAAAGITPQ